MTFRSKWRSAACPVVVLCALSVLLAACRTPQRVYDHADPAMNAPAPGPVRATERRRGDVPVLSLAGRALVAVACVPGVAVALGLYSLSSGFGSSCDDAAGCSTAPSPSCTSYSLPATYHPEWEQGPPRRAGRHDDG